MAAFGVRDDLPKTCNASHVVAFPGLPLTPGEPPIPGLDGGGGDWVVGQWRLRPAGAGGFPGSPAIPGMQCGVLCPGDQGGLVLRPITPRQVLSDAGSFMQNLPGQPLGRVVTNRVYNGLQDRIQ